MDRALTELREQRKTLGISQRAMARELGCNQSQLWRIEAGRVEVTVRRMSEMASILGMEISLGLHPIGDPIRDKGQQALVKRFRALLAPAWRVTQEMPLAITGDLRGWDVFLRGPQRVGADCETRIHDIQALTRRTHLRERDGNADVILIVLSDSATNRRLVNELRQALGERYATPPRQMLAALRRGERLPGSGVMLV
ncbi:MAG TPA: helix-turn-helix transcriptional regulator [Candidatus Limnocylindria bacterium]|nr:helix-turn-helix transcriptional regulator [Candidatus Limnocylindria bacterium]